MDCYNSWSKGCNCKCDVKDVIILKGATLNLPKTSTAPASQHVAVILLLLRSQFRIGKPLPLPPLPHFCSSTLRCSHAPTHPHTHRESEPWSPPSSTWEVQTMHCISKGYTATVQCSFSRPSSPPSTCICTSKPAPTPPPPPPPMTGGPLVLYSVMQLVLWGPLFFSR